MDYTIQQQTILVATSPFAPDYIQAIIEKVKEDAPDKVIEVAQSFNISENWEWIMEIVVKISEYRYPDYYRAESLDSAMGRASLYEDTAQPRTFGMRDEQGNYMVRFNASQLHSAPTLKQAAWMAIVDWISDTMETENTKESINKK